MTMRGIARGRIIELEEPLPYADGQAVDVSVNASTDLPPIGSGARILHTLRTAPAVDPAAVDELERIIRESKRPAPPGGAFDDEV